MSAMVFPFAVGALLIVAVQSCLTGCAKITYKNGPVEVASYRAFWKTEAYKVEMSTNGTAKMEVNNSGVDPSVGATLTTIGQGLIELGKTVK